MKLHELIATTDEHLIIEAVDAIDHKNIRGYIAVLGRLKMLHPAADEGWNIIIGKPHLLPGEDPADYGGVLDISGTNGDDPEHYGIEFTPWAEWLAMDVRVSGVDLTPAQMVAQCLYEMTFLGYDESDIQGFREEINHRVEEIKDFLDEDEKRE